MRIAVISDIHANLSALETVLANIDRLRPDALWCLGDVVGYGPEPQVCADLIRAWTDVCLAGNHDLAISGRLPLQEFNEEARVAALWQRERLHPDTLDWLAGLPSRTETDGITLVHASPRSPIWEYIRDHETVAANYDGFDTPICLMGHTHIAIAWHVSEEEEQISVTWDHKTCGELLSLDLNDRWLLNPGSVGQPRDQNPRASFALLDTNTWTWTWYRCDYDITAVEKAILNSSLPENLGRRLHMGW